MKQLSIILVAAIILAGLLATVGAGAPANAPVLDAGAKKAQGAISPALLRSHTAFLSDDLFEGRGPGSRGDQLAQKYIAAQFERLGLEPAGGNGTYFQPVTLVGKKIDAPANLRVEGRGEPAEFKYFDDFVPYTGLEDSDVVVSGELVFAGYGITAPEFRWNDFKGMDMTGKILVLLVNDPPAPREEPGLFGGKAMTYYGRWTYKYEEAARQNAAGAILIHTTDSAGYPFTVVQSSWTGEQFELPRTPEAGRPLPLRAWVTDEAAQKIFSQAGLNLDSLKQAATRRDFQPARLGLRASTRMQQTVRRIESANVIGLLPGRDAARKDEYVIYTAHFDHLGIGKPVNGDAIYNGAADNSIGVAALLAIAEAMTQLPGGTKRSQVFAAVTAEEAGLLGSAHYARHPVFPPAQTVANINMDGLNQWGPTRDIVLVGSGKSELDQVAETVARWNKMKLLPDQFPEKGFYYRSDQFSLAKIGVPALYFDNGLEVVGKPEDYGKQKFEEYTANDYHQPSDEIKPDWDWSGAEQMARFVFQCGWLAASWEREFDWAPTSEFRAVREESLRKASESGR
ncbi:MAG: M28 family metallopeptidase [Candidatus Acidiferrales bacterium]